MISQYNFLDVAWRLLAVGTLTATIAMGMTLITARVLRCHWSSSQEKWFFNIQMLLLVGTLSSGLVLIAYLDPELASRCFANFVAEGGATFAVTRWLAALWMTGAAALLAFDALRILLSIRSARGFTKTTSGEANSMLQDLCARIGVKSDLGLFTDAHAVSPFAYGLLRHQVVMPEYLLERASPEFLRGVLAHELVHVRDKDSLWLLLELFCRRILFFHPLSYAIRSRYLVAVERAADEQAVSRGGISSREMMRALLELAEQFSFSGPTPLRVGASRGFREIRERVESLGAEPVPGSRRLVLFFAGLSFATLAGVSMAQAGLMSKADPEFVPGMMCTQLKHERALEAWLRIHPKPPPPVRCDP